jgi:hypothetical protein
MSYQDKVKLNGLHTSLAFYASRENNNMVNTLLAEINVLTQNK